MAEMGGITAERATELRQFPQKEQDWTRDESLALIETVDGTECIHGVPLPPFVVNEDDRVRWASCVRVASMMYGAGGKNAAVESPLVQQQARVMYFDRERFSD